MDDDVARRRLLIYSLVRFGGLLIFFLGIAIMGVIDALFAPRLLKKAWDEQDRAQP